MNNVSPFMMGVGVMCMIAITLGINIDTFYDVVDERHLVMRDLCLKFDSTPYSYDVTEVTCNNGVTLPYSAIIQLHMKGE